MRRIKLDWPMQVSIVLGVVVMVASIFTFDHTSAERREYLDELREPFKARGHLDYHAWRLLAQYMLSSDTPEKDLAAFAKTTAKDSPLDIAAFEGIVWYWIALNHSGNRMLEDDVRDAQYRAALRNATERLAESSAADSDDLGARYVWGHYLGRSFARLDEPEGADGPLRHALDAARHLANASDPFTTYTHIETLGGSFDMIGDAPHRRETWDLAVRLQIDRLGMEFDDQSIFNALLRRLTSDEQRHAMREVLAPQMAAWLDEHGEQHTPGRSSSDLGWLYSRLERREDAQAAWQTANAWWEAHHADPGITEGLYHLACSRALIGKHEAALDALDRLVDGGFTEVGRMMQDNNLHTLRDLPRFDAIVRRADDLRKRRGATESDPAGPTIIE